MRIFKRILIIAIIMFTVFLAGCKKCGKNKDDESDGGGSSSGVSIPVDKDGNLNYKLPNETNLSGSVEKVLLACDKIYLTMENPILSIDAINEKAQQTVEELDVEDEVIKEQIAILEKAGITLKQLESLVELLQENKEIIIYFADFFNLDSTEIFEDENYTQALKCLSSFKDIIEKEQAAIVYYSFYYRSYNSTSSSSSQYVNIDYYCFSDRLYTYDELNSYYESITDKIHISPYPYSYEISNSNTSESYIQQLILTFDIYYKTIDVLLSMDKTTSKQVIKAYYNYLNRNYSSLAINVKDNLKAVAIFLDKFLAKFNDKALQILCEDIAVSTINGGYVEETIYLINDKSFPIFINSDDYYKLLPLVEIVVKALQEEKILTQISEYIEKLVDTGSEKDAWKLGLYCIEVIIDKYEKLSQSDKKLLNDFLVDAIPNTIDYTLDELVSTTKSSISKTDLSEMEKVETLIEEITNDLVEADNGGVYSLYEEFEGVFNYTLVKSDTTINKLYEILSLNIADAIRYSSGNLEYNKVSNFEIVSYNTFETGVQTASILINGTEEIEIDYYVFDSLSEFNYSYRIYDIEEFYFSVGVKDNPINRYSSNYFYYSRSFYHKDVNSLVYINQDVYYSDITFYNVDVSTVGSGLGYASFEHSTYGTVYFQIKYNVLPTTSDKITKLYCSYWTMEEKLSNMSYPELSKEVIASCLSGEIYGYKYYAYKSYYNDYYNVSYYNEYNLEITSSDIKSYEIQGSDLYIVINYNGKDYTIRQYLPSEYR